ncbi:AAA family ATPase [Methylobacterium sp. J-070]|uniref:AAA family ATPase n=1 Tax=Methylobacterium sp. J-070 TaxID=2836650 RepID=UPI001FBADD83|nr:AAA family ATPase [Methylobacterium sp. J-070]MCJ2051160.1 AAA family ATPase [Methylobacterium sp. J-070]
MVPPRTLVGGAGGGKTSYARALFRGLGLPEVIHSAAGQIDGGAFAGTNRMWGTWRLSVVAQAIQRFRTASVGVLVDEAEKQGPSRRWGRLDETILPFLERSTTARAIQDPALEVPLDLSGPSYILTANERTGLSQPLLDRAPPVQWPMPRREHMPVAAAAILAEIRQERGLDEAWCPPLDGNELDALSAWRGGSLRPLRRMVQAVLASRESYARLQPN